MTYYKIKTKSRTKVGKEQNKIQKKTKTRKEKKQYDMHYSIPHSPKNPTLYAPNF